MVSTALRSALDTTARSLTAALPSTPTSPAVLAYAGTAAGAAASLVGVLALPGFGGTASGGGGGGAGAVIATGFAAGALLADVFLHVLPHAYEGAGGGHAGGGGGVGGLGVGGWVLVGVTAFYVLERLTGMVTGLLGGHTHGGHGHGGGGTAAVPASAAAPAVAFTANGKPTGAAIPEAAPTRGRTDWAAVKPVAWLNLAADVRCRGRGRLVGRNHSALVCGHCCGLRVRGAVAEYGCAGGLPAQNPVLCHAPVRPSHTSFRCPRRLVPSALHALLPPSRPSTTTQTA